MKTSKLGMKILEERERADPEVKKAVKAVKEYTKTNKNSGAMMRALEAIRPRHVAFVLTVLAGIAAGMYGVKSVYAKRAAAKVIGDLGVGKNQGNKKNTDGSYVSTIWSKVFGSGQKVQNLPKKPHGPHPNPRPVVKPPPMEMPIPTPKFNITLVQPPVPTSLSTLWSYVKVAVIFATMGTIFGSHKTFTNRNSEVQEARAISRHYRTLLERAQNHSTTLEAALEQQVANSQEWQEMYSNVRTRLEAVLPRHENSTSHRSVS
jgi:hypothetical protein